MNSDLIAQLGVALTGVVAILLIVLIAAVNSISTKLSDMMEKLDRRTEPKTAPSCIEASDISEEELAAVLGAISKIVPNVQNASIRLRAVK